MPKNRDNVSRQLGVQLEQFDEPTRRVVRHIAERTHIARNLVKNLDASTSLGQRAADAVASFGGSWTFVGLFAGCMIVWVGLNAVLLFNSGRTFDPYPYILLNLFLSMLAAIQAPIIMMSQNRHAAKDRLDAEHDYEVNLKAELEIMALHEKIDDLREAKWSELVEMQQRQIEILQELLKSKT